MKLRESRPACGQHVWNSSQDWEDSQPLLLIVEVPLPPTTLTLPRIYLLFGDLHACSRSVFLFRQTQRYCGVGALKLVGILRGAYWPISIDKAQLLRGCPSCSSNAVPGHLSFGCVGEGDALRPSPVLTNFKVNSCKFHLALLHGYVQHGGPRADPHEHLSFIRGLSDLPNRGCARVQSIVFAMVLCVVCQNVNIRNLLLLSLENKKYHWTGKWYHPEMPTSFKYHDNIFSLRDGAKRGCELCALIWRGCTVREIELGEAERPEPTDAELAEDYIGAVFLETESWWEHEGSKRGKLLLVVSSRRREDGIDRTPFRYHCKLEVFPKRGKRFLQ